MKKILAFMLFPVCLIGCSKKEIGQVQSGEKSSDSIYSSEDSGTALLSDESSVNTVFPQTMEVSDDSNMNQKLLKIIVAADNAELRTGPGTNYDVETKVSKGDSLYVIGVDDEIKTVGEKRGRWIQVSLVQDSMKSWTWIFSSYTNLDVSFEPNELKCISDTIEQNGQIKVGFNRKSSGTYAEFSIPVENTAGLYSFNWNAANEGFNYADPVGTFIFDSNTKEIVHFSCFGGEWQSAWSKPSPDKKYLLTDYGTSSGNRSVSVVDVENGRTVFSETCYGSANYDNGKIIYMRLGSQDDENVKAFKESNEFPVEYGKDFIEVAELRSQDLSTGENKFIEYQFVFVE